MSQRVEILQGVAILGLYACNFFQYSINRSLSSRIRMLESVERERLRR